MRRSHIYFFVAYVAALVALGWFIWFSGTIQVEYFLALGFGIPVAFFLKSRFVTLIGLLSLPVVLAFVFIGNSDYAILTVAAVFGIIIAFESPMLIYIVLIIWLWFEMSLFSSFIAHPLRMEFIIGIAFFAGWMFKELSKPGRDSSKLYFPERIPIILFFVWALLGFVMWCYEPLPAGWYQLKYLMLGILFVIISPLVLRSEKELRIALWAWIVAGFIGTLTAFYTSLTGYELDIESQWGEYAGAMGIQHSWSASFLCFTFFIMVSTYFTLRSSIIKFALLLCAFATFIAIILQESKGPSVGVTLAFLVFWFAGYFTDRKRRSGLRIIRRVFFILALPTLFLICVYYAGMGEHLGAYRTIFEDPLETPTLQTRFNLWTAAYQMFVNEGHQVRGLGVAAFWWLLPEYGFVYADATEAMDYQKLGVNPHNLYIDTTIHYGIIGLVIFCWFAIGNLLRLWRGYLKFRDMNYRYLCLGLFCALLTFYFSCLFDFTVFIISRYWLFLGLCFAVLNIASKLELHNQQNQSSVDR
jgi:O-antigen ligase